MQGIAFFDLEVKTQPKTKNEYIDLYGAYYEGNPLSTRSLAAFEQFVVGAKYLCGHNIFRHDIPHLEKAGASEALLKSTFIDTLYLSALLFPSRPYHRLVKDYRLVNDHHNNPVEDSRLAADLLTECLDAYHQLPPPLKDIYAALLGEQKEFAAFFKMVGNVPNTHGNVAEIIRDFYLERICQYASLDQLTNEQPVPLAYALALIQAPDAGSIIPPWLLATYASITQVLHTLRSKNCLKDDCRYCQQHLSAQAGLKRYFGYPGFRKFTEEEVVPLQKQVVEAALSDESLLAIFPTGGGKSLSFQLPALMKGAANRSLTVVISPLQALMKDQVDVLRKRHEINSAVAINGLLSPLERADAIEKVREGGVDLLYISPESLRSNTILNLLKGRQIERFVIDEAHCFSSWGQDFRVDYLYIGKFIRQLGLMKNLSRPIPVSCFTATAKPEVIKDIQDYFFKENGLQLKLFQTTATRTNLSYYASRADSWESKINQLLNLLSQTDEPCIVYVSRTKTTEDVAEVLRKSGITAQAFHGQMDSDVKIGILERFTSKDSDIQVIVATSAFGMGVDKENVKMVVHYDISDSLENYLQEAGRAGRNADIQADCHLLFDENDLNEHFALLNQTKLSQKEVGQIWRGIKAFKKKKFSKSALEIAKQAGWDEDMRQLETQVKTAIAALEDAGYVSREQNSPRLFAKSILVRNVEEANQIIRNSPDRFAGKDEQNAIRIFQYLISRDETMVDYLADDLGIRQDKVAHILTHFKELKILDDTYELTAQINPARSQNNSLHCYERYRKLEIALLDRLLPKEESTRETKVYLRDINERIIESGCEQSSIEAIRNLLRFWQHHHLLYKERIDAHSLLYRIKFKVSREVFIEQMLYRHTLATAVINWLVKSNDEQIKRQQKTAVQAFKFSLLKMKQAIEHENIFVPKVHLPEYEKILLYLHLIEVIKLEGGLFVLYNAMTIRLLEHNPKKQYTQQDHEKLERHYEKKVEQIHIMGEYARKQLGNHLEAIKFADDYFRLAYDNFINKYFRGKKGKLKQPITEEKFKQIFGDLSEEQLAVVKDKESDKILLGAGPGSGKTRVLVHKVASLVTMEDVKPEQFLMLTFSRPAAIEFKERLKNLIGKTAYHIDIYTYHGFAFSLLGRLGNLEKSENVIEQVTQALQNREIAADRVMRKSVIVVDEYQDISQAEYDFLQTLIKIAGEVRVMVVGDDDQNIYEFRGSSVAFMRSFVRDQQAKTYFLSKNYRAAANLVEFSNQFLECFSSNRLKAGQPLLAHRTEQAPISINLYNQDSNLILPIAENLQQQKLDGTIAILTHTNQEAMVMYHALLQKDIPAQLVGQQEGFSLKQLLEIRSFTQLIRQHHQIEQGYIPGDTWHHCRNQVVHLYGKSSNLKLALKIIDTFSREMGSRKFWSDWLAYLQEVRMENFVSPDMERVLVSTMHKSKGKEFDHVFLLLNNYQLSDEASKRVVYVAITRAKSSLHIHSKQDIFAHIDAAGLDRKQVDETYPQPVDLQMETGMKDIWLGYFKNEYVIRRMKSLQAGDKLYFSNDPLSGLNNAHGKTVVKFSTSLKEKLRRLTNKGFKPEHAEVAHVVIWFSEEDGRDYRVVLPRLYLNKQAVDKFLPA